MAFNHHLSIHKSVLVAVADNGHCKFTINVIDARRLWRDSNLYCLIFVTYAAGDSKFNMIERIWSVINKCVTGITFAMTLPVEENVPWKQGLLTTETMQKIDQVCIQYFICTVKKFVLECNELYI